MFTEDEYEKINYVSPQLNKAGAFRLDSVVVFGKVYRSDIYMYLVYLLDKSVHVSRKNFR